MNELQTAVRLNKIIYVFIQSDVSVENNTYIANKSTGSFIPTTVDDNKVHEFICEIKASIKNHPIESFNDVATIINYLRQQFAGLFQSLLAQKATQTEIKTYHDIKEVSDLIKSLTNDFILEKDDFFNKFDGSIFAIKPIVRHICHKIGYKKFALFAKNIEALEEFLNATGFEDKHMSCDKREYIANINGVQHILSIDQSIFDENTNIKNIRISPDTIDNLIDFKPINPPPTESIIDDDDLPF
ncbi:MAG: hypothetical protein FWC73_11790 [Defluviitaleaceae bacterium]|nr:hypothetical protein [Defluviitaleaceae bacterium]